MIITIFANETQNVSGQISAGDFFLSFFKDFIGTPAILVGLFSMLGAILLRKKFSQVLVSMFKTIAGFLIITAGATFLQTPLVNFQNLFVDLFGVKGIIPNNDAFAGWFFDSTAKIGNISQLGSIIMVVSMVMNMILAGTSRFRYIYLSGHVLFYMSIMLAGVMILGGDFNMSSASDFVIALIACSLFMSVYMVLSAAGCRRFVKQITGQNDISMAHTGSFGYIVSGYIGELVYHLKKGKVKSTEKINFPKKLDFFRNTFISISITMLILFMIVYIPEGIMYNTGIKNINNITTNSPITEIFSNNVASAQTFLRSVFGTSATVNWVVQMLLGAFIFAASVEIIIFGVRMLIGELVPSFKGISDKFLKNTKASLDCPIVFPYAPNAVLIGFVISFMAGIVGMAITIGLTNVNKNLEVILVGIVPHFFLGATSGVYGNAKGGIWGAILGAFVHGLFIQLMPLVFIVFNWTPSNSSLVWGDSDYITGGIMGAFVSFRGITSRILVITIPAVIFILLIVDGVIKWYREKHNLVDIWAKFKKKKIQNVNEFTDLPSKI